ncbi:hypothetical protein EI94DRAFT_1696855 [Lactarius quietus]|nr:hypothetical protein EI94DRAFT_1696855 [Lactarius quietus]
MQTVAAEMYRYSRPAKSAGAQLQRYGEQALRDDIHSLLSGCMNKINQCERIWIRASASNQGVFLDCYGAVIAKVLSSSRWPFYPNALSGLNLEAMAGLPQEKEPGIFWAAKVA